MLAVGVYGYGLRPLRPILLSLLMVFPPAPPQPTTSILGIPKSSSEFEKSMASVYQVPSLSFIAFS